MNYSRNSQSSPCKNNVDVCVLAETGILLKKQKCRIARGQTYFVFFNTSNFNNDKCCFLRGINLLVDPLPAVHRFSRGNNRAGATRTAARHVRRRPTIHTDRHDKRSRPHPDALSVLDGFVKRRPYTGNRGVSSRECARSRGRSCRPRAAPSFRSRASRPWTDWWWLDRARVFGGMGDDRA
jgi:hypothetical protein